jgi:hypothetical protein
MEHASFHIFRLFNFFTVSYELQRIWLKMIHCAHSDLEQSLRTVVFQSIRNLHLLIFLKIFRGHAVIQVRFSGLKVSKKQLTLLVIDPDAFQSTEEKSTLRPYLRVH